MRIKQLIAFLSEGNPEDEVRIALPTHNHWRQVEAVEICPLDSGPAYVAYSGYLHCDEVLDNDVVGEDREVKRVFLLRG